jgi:hypothetical protein
MQQLEIWHHKNDIIVNSEEKHVQYNIILTKTDILVDLTLYLIKIIFHTVQN